MAEPMRSAPVELPQRYIHQDWMERGICRGDGDLFFPPRGERPQARERREAQARVVCRRCPVLLPCRWYARLHREYGFWGGVSEEERAAAGYPGPLPVGGRPLRPVTTTSR